MFRIGDVIIDRLQIAVAKDFDNNDLYVLTQLADASINIQAESEDVTDAQGNLIKKVWKSKTGTFEANNAMINANVIASNSGSEIEYATDVATISMPIIKTVKAGNTLKLDDGYVDSTITVSALYNNGTMGESFEKGTSASATEFAVSAEGVLTLPTPADTTITQFVVFYNKNASEGAKNSNYVDKYPKTVQLYIKALYINPCEPDVLRACIIHLPSFQPSPEVSLELTTDSQMNFSGDLQIDYCSADKVLYHIYYLPDDED